MNAELRRLERGREKALWHRWGPYLSERQWGTVREDYSPDGTAWEYLPHDHARSRAYRWGEDGIAGICDRYQLLCFAVALWNGNDPILKERLFGLTGNEGNHGEDVKEYYFFLDALPSHAYMKMLYRYPQAAYPYSSLVAENRRRTKLDPEFELIDTGIFDGDRFFDVFVEYAKAAPDDILIRITVANRGPARAKLALLPTIWFRNVWSWKAGVTKPSLEEEPFETDIKLVRTSHETLGSFRLYCEEAEELLFTENETNAERLFNSANPSPYVKDGIDDYVVRARRDTVNPSKVGTKCAARYALDVAPGQTQVVRLRLCNHAPAEPFGDFEKIFQQRVDEADEFYRDLTPYPVGDDERLIQRQAMAGLLWSKQFYHYVIHDWLKGDPLQPPPPASRVYGRNSGWDQFYSDDVVAMPDTWEYPWFAAWDLAFHCIALSLVDPAFAKVQLSLLTREYYMHPNGQIPAYEWAFGDVNPPVQAWAAYRVFKMERKRTGHGDLFFLERVFQKLLLSFTWWVNRKDVGGRNVFQGGFLGLDNIGIFDRSAPLPGGGRLDQADGTSWMGVFTLNMLAIAIELAREMPVYEDIASKFFEHFLLIADAMNKIGGEEERGLWDDEDGFYYDYLHTDGKVIPLQIRSLVGLTPLLAVETFDGTIRQKLPNLANRIEWFVRNRPDLIENIAAINAGGVGIRRILSIVDRKRLERLLCRMLDESEFLSPHGIRSLSRKHGEAPYSLLLDGHEYRIDYEPAESTSGIFGGNSNWRGPVWFPINFLIIEALQKYHYFYGDDFKVEMPTGSGKLMTLWEVSMDLSHRLMKIFTRDRDGRRAVFGGNETFQRNPLWRDYVPFYEYFHGDNGAGLGASHQTGWTALVAKLIQQCGEYCGQEKHPFD
ncbi:MAG: glucosidase [Candidatus Eremiobacteraeota bacterium]|nr:glucosidase [Candidatus Eremiobacteraeota bacterium]